jgi:hypothetical protein
LERGNGPLAFLTEMKLKCGRRLYNYTKPAKAHVLRPGFLKINCVEQIYTCLCAVFLWFKMCTKSVKICAIIKFLQNAAEKRDCFETVLFLTFLKNWITLKEFYINNSDLKNYATKLTFTPFYIALCHTQIPCYYLYHIHGYCCSFFRNSATDLRWIAFTLEIFLQEVVTSGEIWPSCRTINFPIPRFVYTDSNFRRFRWRVVQVLRSFYMSSFLVIWIIENYLSS